jgi:hypothetical protein
VFRLPRKPGPERNRDGCGRVEWATAATGIDGHFDLPAGAGGVVRVRYTKAGFMTVERPVATSWNDYAWAPDVVVTALDPNATAIELDASDWQVARGSVHQDADGARQATLLFPPGTTARRIDNGVAADLPGPITVGATEFTVGSTGRQAMPAPLPPTTAYTYAVEFTVRGAETADRVEFATTGRVARRQALARSDG